MSRIGGRHLLITTFFSIACFLLLANFLDAQTPTFRSDVNLVTVTFTVRDASGKLVGDLSQDDVEVFEDGVPQKIRFFARSSDLPLAIGLVVDTSDSQSKFIHRHRADVEKFLRDVLGPKDRSFLLCFGNHLRLVSDFTSSPEEIMDNLDFFNGKKDNGKRKTFPEIGPKEIRQEGTAFYDAIFYSIQDKLTNVEQGRRVLILFSDGQDNSSAHHMIDAIEAAQRADVLVYSVRYTEERKHMTSRDKYGIRVMQRISHDTGAADYDAIANDLDTTFQSIGAELRTQYGIGYHASDMVHDDSFHKVAIRVKKPGFTVRAKAGYFAGQ